VDDIVPIVRRGDWKTAPCPHALDHARAYACDHIHGTSAADLLAKEWTLDGLLRCDVVFDRTIKGLRRSRAAFCARAQPREASSTLLPAARAVADTVSWSAVTRGDCAPPVPLPLPDLCDEPDEAEALLREIWRVVACGGGG
jgi:hypothetical protein